MTALGWGDEIQMLGVDKFGKYKHVRKSQKLTEKSVLHIPLLSTSSPSLQCGFRSRTSLSNIWKK